VGLGIPGVGGASLRAQLQARVRMQAIARSNRRLRLLSEAKVANVKVLQGEVKALKSKIDGQSKSQAEAHTLLETLQQDVRMVVRMLELERPVKARVEDKGE